MKNHARIQEFSSGGPGQTDKKKLCFFFFFFFFFFFLILSLFYRSQMVNFKEIYHFSRFQRGSNIFQGVPHFFRGSNCLFPIETHITCDFPGGGPDPLSPPLDPHLKTSCFSEKKDHDPMISAMVNIHIDFLFRSMNIQVLRYSQQP